MTKVQWDHFRGRIVKAEEQRDEARAERDAALAEVALLRADVDLLERVIAATGVLPSAIEAMRRAAREAATQG